MKNGKDIVQCLFYIRKTKLNKQGEAPISLRIDVNGVHAEAYTHR